MELPILSAYHYHDALFDTAFAADAATISAPLDNRGRLLHF